MEALPDPSIDLTAFVSDVRNNKDDLNYLVFDVLKEKMVPWVDCATINSSYNPTPFSLTSISSCSCM